MPPFYRARPKGYGGEGGGGGNVISYIFNYFHKCFVVI